MKMEYKIENKITPRDYNNLRKSVGWDSKNMQITQNALDSSVIVKKATFENKAIGMARVVGDGLYYYIVDVVVNPEYQNKGIGKLLIESIVKDIEARTKIGQKCSIYLISMKGKEEFYEKCGFTKIPYDYTGYGMIRRIEK